MAEATVTVQGEVDALFHAAKGHIDRGAAEDAGIASAQFMRALAKAPPDALDQPRVDAHVNHLTSAWARAAREPW